MSAFITGCATQEPKIIAVDNVTHEAGILTFPYKTLTHRLISIDEIGANGIPLTFVLDTGATKSAIFASTAAKLNETPTSNERAFVHGMTGGGSHRIIEMENFKLGTRRYDNMSFVLLEDRDYFGTASSNEVPYDGLIGMDVLSDYVIYISGKTSQIKLIPNDLTLDVPIGWHRVELIENPIIDHHKLHFLETRLNGKLIPTLLDTGAEFSIMNWHTASYPEMKRRRKRMKEDWKIQGAVGEFSPKIKVRVTQLRSGQKRWFNKDFIVMDLDNLDILGMRDAPYAIAGANLFADETMVIDFERNYIAYQPRTEDVSSSDIFTVHINQ
jgi:predicted aspartyl protease